MINGKALLGWRPDAGRRGTVIPSQNRFRARLVLASALVLPGAFLLLFQPAKAGPGSSPNDATVRAAIEQAVAIEHPSPADQPAVKILARDDLNGALSRISANTANVSFYEADVPSADLAGDHSVWAIVPSDSPLEPYELYDFGSSEGMQHSSQEFNRLISQLGLSVPSNKAGDIGRLFLSCCVLDAPGELIANEDTLHHSVERDYMQVYGQDVYRMLAAFADWWQGYAGSGYRFPPAVQPEPGGGAHVTLERVVLKFGMHPQLRQYGLEVARNGTVQSLTFQPVFPKQDRFLSFDSRTGPQFQPPKDGHQHSKNLAKN